MDSALRTHRAAGAMYAGVLQHSLLGGSALVGEMTMTPVLPSALRRPRGPVGGCPCAVVVDWMSAYVERTVGVGSNVSLVGGANVTKPFGVNVITMGIEGRHRESQGPATHEVSATAPEAASLG